MYRQFAKKYILHCKIYFFVKYIKNIHFDFISDFPISIPKSGCSPHILAQEFQVQNSSNKATPQNIQATPFGVATNSLTNTVLEDEEKKAGANLLVHTSKTYFFLNMCINIEIIFLPG